MSTHGPPPDSRSPTIEASSPQPMDLDDVDQHLTLGHAVRGRYIKPTGAAAKSLNLMRDEIEGLLEEPWRKNFANTANHLMRLGNKNPKMVKPRRQKLRDIITNNVHVAKLYNEYAVKHAESETRVTYRLPIFADLERQDDSDKGKLQDGDGNTDQQDGHGNTEQQDGHGNTEQQEGGSIAEQDGVEEEERQDEDQGSEQKDEGEEDAVQTAGEIHDNPDEMNLQELLPDPALQPIPLAESEIDDLGMEQTEQALDKEMENGQANLTGNDHESTKNNTAEHEVNADAEMMSIDVLPRAEAPLAQRRHVHFAPQATLIQEQPNIVVEPSKSVDIEVQPPQKKATKAVTPVTNPEAFPIERVQVVQAQYYPSAKIVNAFTQRNPSGEVVRVTADMQDGPVNHFSIHDARIITALGLRNGDGDTILIDEKALKMHETFTMTILPNQRVKNLNNFVVGELKSARHAYLHWLDYRQCADPTCPPFAVEARKIAVQLGRRAHDVWKEIDGYWQLEQGSGGIQYRNNRLKHLGEDVRYEVKVTEKRRMPSMWG